MQDIGKQAGASGDSNFYVRSGVAAGPGSSIAEYHPTQDIGKQVGSSGEVGVGVRRTGDAAGPTSSVSSYQYVVETTVLCV